MSQPTYNLRNIRKLLTVAFTDDELRQLCYDVSQFRPVYEQFSAGMGKGQMIQHLIEYCERKGLMEELLAVVRDEVPGRYAEFENKLGHGPASGETDSSSALAKDNSDVEHLQKLLTTNTRRLHALQEQAALYGISTPPQIKLQIEDLEAEITDLKQQLKS
jgi:hypothetical protein